MKKLIMISFLFCWCINIYGQESITDTIMADVTDYITVVSPSDIFYPWLDPIWVDFVKLYEEYETECFNDSTEQCFNHYRDFHLIGSALDSLVFEDRKTPCGKYDYDLGSDDGWMGTHKEWVHVQPSFIGFMRYLKKKR